MQISSLITPIFFFLLLIVCNLTNGGTEAAASTSSSKKGGTIASGKSCIKTVPSQQDTASRDQSSSVGNSEQQELPDMD